MHKCCLPFYTSGGNVKLGFLGVGADAQAATVVAGGTVDVNKNVH